MKDFRQTPKHMVRLNKPDLSAIKEKENIAPDSDYDDDVSYQRHVKLMQQEFKKGRPKNQVSSELMGVTFKRRHAEIISQSTAVSTVITQFPFSQNYEEDS